MPATLGYYKVRGYAQSIRLLLEYTGTDYNEKMYEIGPAPTYSRSQWFDIKFTLGLDLPNVPYYIDESHKLTQSNAILRYIARKHGLAGKSEEDYIKIDMLENQVMDMRMAWGKLCYFNPNFETDKATYLEETLPAHLKLMNNFIGSNKWFTGNQITFVDFLIYELLDINKELSPECLDEFPNLKDFVDRFESLEAIKKYMNSSRYIKGPINGPMAKFGGK